MKLLLTKRNGTKALILTFLSIWLLQAGATAQILEGNVPRFQRSRIQEVVKRYLAKKNKSLDVQNKSDLRLMALDKGELQPEETAVAVAEEAKLSATDSVELTNELESLADSAELVPSADLSYLGGTNVSTLKTNIQAFKFILGGKALNVPVYLTLSPDVQLSHGTESLEEKAKRLLSETGGSLSIAFKKYYQLWGKGSHDFSGRFDWQGNVGLNGARDTSGKDQEPGASLLVGAGLNLEASLQGNGETGRLTVDAHLNCSVATSEETFHRVFGTGANTVVAGVHVLAKFIIVNFINFQADYSRSFGSGIDVLDHGSFVYALGVGGKLPQL